MILTHFMRKNVKRKAKVAKSDIHPPQRQSPVSTVASTSPEEIFDINERSTDSRMIEDSPQPRDASVDGPSSSTSPTPLNVASPFVLDYNPEPFESLFPQELLNGKCGSHGSTWNLHLGPVPEPAIAEATPLTTAKDHSIRGPTYQQANISHSREPSDRMAPSTSKKSIPAPIFIPEVEGPPTNALNGRPPMSVVKSAPSQVSNLQPFPSTSPPSPMSSEDMSAISGTTLARALIGNSFILSSSDRGSRYRSGMTRQDSATLPRGEHLLAEFARAPDSGYESTVPPVPPLPLSAGAHLLDQARAFTDKSPASPGASASTTENSPSGASYASPDIIMHSRLSRRISRISEVPSPVPTTPMSPQSIRDAQPMKSGSSIAASSMLARMDETDSDVPNSASHTPPTASSQPSFHRTETGVSSTSFQSSEPSPSPTDGLDGYHFVAPDSPQPAASIGSDVSTPFVGNLQTKSSEVSLKKRRTKALRATPSSMGGRSFKASGVLPNSIFQRNKKQIRLPIGERPRSIIVPQTPITPALTASATAQHSSALSQFPLVPTSAVPAGHIEMPLSAFADLDILATSPPLSGMGIFAQRQRAEQTLGIPGQVAIGQEYDLLDYAITVSPKSQGSPNYPSPNSSTGEQTFPETPNVFTPLFTPHYPVLQLPDGRPQALRSATDPAPQDVADKGTLSRALTLGVPAQREGLLKDDSSSAPRRPMSAAPLVKSTPSPEPVPPEITSEVPPVSVSPLTGQKTDTTDQKVDIRIPPQSSPVDPVIYSPLYHLSMSSDKLQEDEVLQQLGHYSASSIPSISAFISMPSKSPSLVKQPDLSPTSIPLPGSKTASPSLSFTRSGSISSLTSPSNSPNLQSSSPNLQHSSTNLFSPSALSPKRSQLLSPQPQAAFSKAISSVPDPLSLRPESGSHVAGTSFLPSVSPPPPSTPSRSPAPPSPVNSLPSFTPSFVPPPPYHSVIPNENDTSLARSISGGTSSRETASSENTDHHPSVSVTQSHPPNVRSRARIRPPLPIGPRKPSGPGQPLGSFVPGIRERGGSVSSVGSGFAHGSGSGYAWRKLTAAASTPPPKFQTPPQRWRGLTMEAAQWTLSQHELQTMVSRAIKQSAEASSIRLLKSEVLDVDIPDEVHRLELQRTDVKSKYKSLVRKRWQLMGVLAGHLDGPDLSDPMTAARTVEELSEVSLALDQLTDELHTIVEQLGQLKSLRDVHSASALAMALRKVNTTFLKQVAESQTLREQIESMEAERDEAWKQAQDVAQDFDNLTDQVMESRGEQAEGTPSSRTSSRRSARVSAVRKSSIRQSKAGLRSLSRCRSQRSSVSSSGTRTSLMMSMSATSDDIPPVPPLPLHRPLGIVTSNLSGRSSLVGSTSNTSVSSARALAQAQRELYEMLGLTLQETPSEAASSRPRSVSGLLGSRHIPLNPRPMSDVIAVRPSRARENRAIHSVLYDDRQIMLAQLGMMTN